MIQAEWRVSPPDGLSGRRVIDVVNQEITRGLETLSMEFERRVRLRTPVGVFGDGGGLRGQIFGEVRGTPAREAYIGHTSVYGDVIELGRRPGPISETGRESIRLWVQKVLRPAGDRLDQVAFAVTQKIRTRGFPGAHMFQRALDEGRGVIDTVWARVGDAIAERLR